ncbi:MAG: SDR family oxidoreductase [Dehalococcoidia bacterium]
MPQRELEGRSAIITGAGAGLGKGIALAFAAEGANVVLTARRAQPLQAVAAEIKSAGHADAMVVTADVSKEADVDALFDQVVGRYGKVDIVVNNAGIAGEVGNIWELSLAGWQETIDTNLTGPWLCTRAAAKVMLPRREGKIINIGSISGKRPLATRTPYTSSKMGLVGLTRTAAVELGEHNINVNLISPGAVQTERLALLAQSWKRPLQDLIDEFSELAAFKRLAQVDDIANLAVFLASERSRNITGVDITCSAGQWFD